MSQNNQPKRIWLDVSQIAPNPFQPRKVFSQSEIENLAASISEIGLLQQISVRQISDDKAWNDETTHWLIAGEKRTRALRLLVERGEHSGRIEVEEHDVDDLQMMQMTMDENLQRSDINPLDKAWGFAELERLGLTQAKIGERYRLTQPAVSNFIRLLKLPDPVQLLMRGDEWNPPEISAGHGMALLMLKTPQDQISWGQKAVAYSVKALEREIRAFLDAEEDRMNPPLVDPPKIPKPNGPKPNQIPVPPVVEVPVPEIEDPEESTESDESEKPTEPEPVVDPPVVTPPVTTPPAVGGFVMAPIPASEMAFIKSKGLSTATALVFVRRLFEISDSSPELTRILEADGMGGVLDHLQSVHGDN